MSNPHRRASDQYRTELARILIDGDLSLVAVLLGFGMIVWGSIGIFLNPQDLFVFAKDFAFQMPIFWGINSIGLGFAFLWVAVKKFPAGPCLLLGTYCVTVYTWIAVSRAVSSITSGVTLNLLVIVVGALIIHRSGHK
jgi:hypothetical protein